LQLSNGWAKMWLTDGAVASWICAERPPFVKFLVFLCCAKRRLTGIVPAQPHPGRL